MIKTIIISFTILASIYMLLVLLPMALENIINRTSMQIGNKTVSFHVLEP